MGLTIDENYTISIYQGDSGNLEVNGLPTDKNYSLHFGIRNADTNISLAEVVEQTNGQSSCTIKIPSSATNNLNIQKGRQFQFYNWGLKLCDENGTEDTLFFGNTTYGSVYKLKAYPKKVEGV